MKIIYIATGAANMYCGSCMRDNTLAAAMKAQGHDVTLIPLYTPMRLDEEDVGERRIFYGGIEAYLHQRFPRPSLGRDVLLRLSSAQGLLRMMPRFDMGSAVDPVKNAELTLSMLRGENGHQNELLKELVSWLATAVRPDLIHVTNTLISGIVPALKQALKVPIICGLHGEDIFLDGLPEPYRAEALALICQNAASIDHFIAISQYYADVFPPRVGLDPTRISLVRPGIALDDYEGQPRQTLGQPPTIGYLARISPEKGLHLLVDAFIRLCQAGDIPGLRLKIAGYLSRANSAYTKTIFKQISRAKLEDRVEMLGTVDRVQKRAFYRSLDVFAVPTIYKDPKGLPVLEALANGVPVVQPDHGAFTELVHLTHGGLLHRPEDPSDLAAKLATMLQDHGLRVELACQGYQSVRKDFSAGRMARDTIQVYQRLIGDLA
ncbi:MAG: glycosyltransferase family 1 protein [Chloroflexota bacterium]|nr:MAG: glycosyltransferase family 1 protein [Chloroflexota bacterium]